VRSLWAVACAVSVSVLLLTLAGGCAGTKSQVKEFNRMEVGEGPREALNQMIEMQKEPGGQRIEANPVLVSPGKGKNIPESADRSSGNLSMSGATGNMRDGKPAVSPQDSSPLPVQTDVQIGQLPASAPVPPASVALRYSPPPPSRKATPPVVASVERPIPEPPVKSPAPATTTARPPEPKLTPVAPAPIVAPAHPPVSAENAPAPVPPVSHQMSLTKEATIQTSSRETPSSLPTPPPSANEKKKTVAPRFTGGSNYRIGPEDVLHVDVWGNPELTRDAIVRPDGMISLPLIQDVKAEGLTAADLSGRIQRKLLSFIKNPEVAVIVTQINAPKMFVIGQVTRPGTYPLRGDVSVLQALSLAGGFTPFASPKKIKVISKKGGKQEVHKVNYYDIIGKDKKADYYLKPGDTVVVP
jgi:polysaccharide export outer membrane protein